MLHLGFAGQTNQSVCLCICIQREDRKWAWFILEVTLNQANNLFSNLICIGNAILVPSKQSNEIDLILTYNQLWNVCPLSHTIIFISLALFFKILFLTKLSFMNCLNPCWWCAQVSWCFNKNTSGTTWCQKALMSKPTIHFIVGYSQILKVVHSTDYQLEI